MKERNQRDKNFQQLINEHFHLIFAYLRNYLSEYTKSSPLGIKVK